MPTRDLINLEDVREARTRINDGIVATPTFKSVGLSNLLERTVLVKAENLQVTGSFKIRGALNTMRQPIGNLENPEGYVTFSAGNHAMAVAYAARMMKKPAVVCMPPGAVQEKVETVRQLGAEVVETANLMETCDEIATNRGYEVIPPFDSKSVVTGQATVGLEIVEYLEQHELHNATIMVPVGGGGLIAGVATAVKAVFPSTRVIGFEPESANAMRLSWEAGEARPLAAPANTIADGLAAPFAGKIPYRHVSAFVDDLITVKEEDIRASIWPVLQHLKMIVEPASVVPVAAVLSGAYEPVAHSPLVIVASGANISRTVLQESLGLSG